MQDSAEDRAMVSERNKDAFGAWLRAKGCSDAQVESVLAALRYFSDYCVQQLQCAELTTVATSEELGAIRERLIKRLFATFDQYHSFIRERESPPPDEAPTSPAPAFDEEPSPEVLASETSFSEAPPEEEPANAEPITDMDAEAPDDPVSDEAGQPEQPDQAETNETIEEQIEQLVLDAGPQGTTLEDIIEALSESGSAAQADALREMLAGAPRVIPMPKDRYVHADSFSGLEQAKEDLREILTTHFSWMGGRSNAWLLFDAAREKLPGFLRDNHCEDRGSVYAIARYLFGREGADGPRFVFNPPRILDAARAPAL